MIHVDQKQINTRTGLQHQFIAHALYGVSLENNKIMQQTVVFGP